jgi:hypothetical protein
LKCEKFFQKVIHSLFPWILFILKPLPGNKIPRQAEAQPRGYAAGLGFCGKEELLARGFEGEGFPFLWFKYYILA